MNVSTVCTRQHLCILPTCKMKIQDALIVKHRVRRVMATFLVKKCLKISASQTLLARFLKKTAFEHEEQILLLGRKKSYTESFIHPFVFGRPNVRMNFLLHKSKTN